MTRMTQLAGASGAVPSRLVAREIRAELGRQQLSQRRLAVKMGNSYQWVQRRVSLGATLLLTVDDIQAIADALAVPPSRFLAGWLPGGDTEQSPRASTGSSGPNVYALRDIAATVAPSVARGVRAA